MKNSPRSVLLQYRFYLLTFSAILVMMLFFFLFPTDEGPRQDDSVTKVYYADNISEAHSDLIHRFNEAYKGRIEVIPIDLPFSKFSTNERKELLARSLRSKSNLIDVFSVDYIWVHRFAKWCTPLHNHFTAKEINALLPHVIKSCSYDSQLVAMPHYTDIAHMYYRHDLIAQLPNAKQIETELSNGMTWHRFIELGKNIQSLGYKQPVFLYPIDNFEGLTCCFHETLGPHASEIFNGDHIQINDPAAVNGVRFLSDLVHRYQLTPEEAYTFDEYQGYVHALQSDAFFFRGWPGLLQHHRAQIPNGNKLDYVSMAPLPYFEEFGPEYVYGGWNLMISKHSAKKQEAIEFIRFALDAENQKRFFHIGGYLPAVKAAYADSVFIQSHPMLSKYRKLLEQGVHRPYTVDYTRTSDIISFYVHQAISGKMSASEAMNRAQTSIESRSTILK